MIGKKEIYIGLKNERYDSILRVLDEKKIKYEVRAMEEHHVNYCHHSLCNAPHCPFYFRGWKLYSYPYRTTEHREKCHCDYAEDRYKGIIRILAVIDLLIHVYLSPY